MLEFLAILLTALAWIGHAYILIALVNHLYGRPLPKSFLKLWRYLTAVLILAFPLAAWWAGTTGGLHPPLSGFVTMDEPQLAQAPRSVGMLFLAYCIASLYFGMIFPVVTLERYLRKPPACVRAEHTRTLDFWPEHGEKLIGSGKYRPLTRIPGNGVFRLDITELTLAQPNLPAEWNGLTLLVLSDLHFHGTPSRTYFDRVIAELTTGPVPDVVCLVGDYLDSDTHHEWIVPLLGRLQAKEAKLAILGNHDKHHDPDRVRAELSEAGYTVVSNGWKAIVIRGVLCVVVGHEGPWFSPPPDLGGAPTEPFRLCLSHTPDNFYWAIANKISLMFCGHVHGGGIRVPVIGSIFVPSIYGRRFDCGVFEESGTVMAVSRGLGGKEPIRIRCNPQVLRVTLQSASTPLVG